MSRLRTAAMRPALSRMTSLDRGGAHALLDASVATALRRGTFAIKGLTPASRSWLERFGVLGALDVMEDVETAAAGVPKEEHRAKSAIGLCPQPFHRR
jgi:hypothetical protein